MCRVKVVTGTTSVYWHVYTVFVTESFSNKETGVHIVKQYIQYG